MQDTDSRGRRRQVARLGVGIVVTFVAAQFRPAKGKAPKHSYVVRDRAKGFARKARRGAGA
jgi:hypothetical protein